MRTLEFWFDYASTYSYLSAMRIEAAAGAAGVTVHWRPFLLGPIFRSQGWTSSPFNLFPAKGRYMVRDMQRLCSERGLAFAMPEPFPANSLHAARIGLIAADESWIAAFTRAVYVAQFAHGANIADEDVLRGIVISLNQDADRIFHLSRTEENKSRLKQQTEKAEELGIFGAPTFLTGDGELFWGDDRLDRALAWH